MRQVGECFKELKCMINRGRNVFNFIFFILEYLIKYDIYRIVIGFILYEFKYLYSIYVDIGYWIFI